MIVCCMLYAVCCMMYYWMYDNVGVMCMMCVLFNNHISHTIPYHNRYVAQPMPASAAPYSKAQQSTVASTVVSIAVLVYEVAAS